MKLFKTGLNKAAMMVGAVAALCTGLATSASAAVLSTDPVSGELVFAVDEITTPLITHMGTIISGVAIVIIASVAVFYLVKWVRRSFR